MLQLDISISRDALPLWLPKHKVCSSKPWAIFSIIMLSRLLDPIHCCVNWKDPSHPTCSVRHSSSTVCDIQFVSSTYTSFLCIYHLLHYMHVPFIRLFFSYSVQTLSLILSIVSTGTNKCFQSNLCVMCAMSPSRRKAA